MRTYLTVRAGADIERLVLLRLDGSLIKYGLRLDGSAYLMRLSDCDRDHSPKPGFFVARLKNNRCGSAAAPPSRS